MKPCPSEEQLTALLAQELSAAETGVIEDHVEGCPGCQARLQKLVDEEGAATSQAVRDLHTLTKHALAGPGALSAETATSVLPAPGMPRKLGRYRVESLIGSGGMGVVWRGYDPELKREVALKLLREENRDHPECVQRFVREARITGRLQHPAIVPVHELGYEGGLPFLAMKLIDGRTLAELLAVRQHGERDLPHLLSIFEQVCQAVGFAHTRHVIHRDLKPSNVMVGAFGEVQVMDWGLAKVLEDRTGVDGDAPAPEDDATDLGMILGTPAYLAPEQAGGGQDRVDARADVFGLGALLCEILTGQPPYHGPDKKLILAQALQADLTGAFERLARCGADPELIQLARDCLAPGAAGRPQDAQVVAARVTAYRNGVQERLRAAEMERATATARAEEAQARAAAEAMAREEALAKVRVQRRARRLTLASAALVVLALAAAGGTFLLHRQERLAQLADLTRKVEEECAQARALGDEGKTAEGLDALKRAEARMGDAGPDYLRARIRQERRKLLDELADDAERKVTRFRSARNWEAAEGELNRTENLLAGDDLRDTQERLRRLRAALAQAKQDQDTLSRLDRARVPVDLARLKFPGLDRKKRGDNLPDRFSPDIDSGRVDEAYRAAFKRYGLDVDTLEERSAGERIRQSAIADPLIVALDDWYWHRNKVRGPDSSLLLRTAEAADTNPFRRRLRRAVLEGDTDELRKAAAREELVGQPPATHLFLATGLAHAAEHGEALKVLLAARRRYPDDFVLNWALASAYFDARPPQYPEAIRYYTAAVSLRPDFAPAYFWLGVALCLDDPEAAEEAFKKVIELTGEHPPGLFYLALAQGNQGRFGAALRSVRRAEKAAGPEPNVRQGAEEMIAVLRPLADKETRVLGILERPAVAEDLPDLSEFSRLFDELGRYRTAARLYAKMFEADPELKDKRGILTPRHNAAWCALLASFNEGTDSKILGAEEQSRLRGQALAWLREELAVWTKALDAGEADPKLVVQVLNSWWIPNPNYPRLLPPLSPHYLARLSPKEREEWRKLDREVDVLLRRADAPK
jgi:tRNA A-37 threonylcarbamoyl transferase component Bud32/tetratricopeptide (TPR) repeat protein